MDITRFKTQHVEILGGIGELRRLAKAGISENAHAIAQKLAALSSVVTRHLAVENRILYPAVQQAADPALARMGKAYQDEMEGIANAYIAFSRRWETAQQVREQPEQFREDANKVLKVLHERMQKENREFYPAVDAM